MSSVFQKPVEVAFAIAQTAALAIERQPGMTNRSISSTPTRRSSRPRSSALGSRMPSMSRRQIGKVVKAKQLEAIGLAVGHNDLLALGQHPRQEIVRGNLRAEADIAENGSRRTVFLARRQAVDDQPAELRSIR